MADRDDEARRRRRRQIMPRFGAWLELRKQYGDEVGELARVLAEEYGLANAEANNLSALERRLSEERGGEAVGDLRRAWDEYMLWQEHQRRKFVSGPGDLRYVGKRKRPDDGESEEDNR